MTTNAEATGSREALTRKFVRCNRVYNPPIEGVRDGGWCEWAVADDGTAWERWGFGEWEQIDPLPPRAAEEGASLTDTLSDLRKIWTPSREDFEAVSRMRTGPDDAPRERCKAPPNDDPPAGKGGAPPEAQETADGRVFVAWQWENGRKSWSEVLYDGILTWTPKDWDEHHPSHAPHLVLVPASELVRVQRERDEAMNEMMHWNGESVRLENECATLRAQLASALDAARKELQSAQRDLDAALDRARVAEQRIETGVVYWARESGSAWNREPTPTEVTMYGPFTRGRFVADTEGA